MTTVPATSRPGTGFLGPRSPKTEAEQIRLSSHEVPGAPVQTRRLNPEKHLVVGEPGSW